MTIRQIHGLLRQHARAHGEHDAEEEDGDD
jgi:hypothetical protein